MPRSGPRPYQSPIASAPHPVVISGTKTNWVSGAIRKAVSGEAASSTDWAKPKTRPCRANGTTFCSVVCSRSEEHTSELQSLMRISYAVFCLKKKKEKRKRDYYTTNAPDDTRM